MKKNRFDEKFKNMPIKKKLVTSFGFVIVTTFLLIVTLLVGMKAIEGKVEGLFEGPTNSTFYVGDIRFGLVANQRAINRIVAVGESVLEEEEANMKANVELIVAAHDKLVTTLITEENKKILEEIWSLLEKEEEYRDELHELFIAGDLEGANEYDESTYTPLVNEIRAKADILDASIFEAGEEYTRTAAIVAMSLIVICIILSLAITAFAIFLALKVTVSITEPIAQIETAAKQLRVGDLSQADSITYESEDELGVLAKTMRESIHILDAYIKEICENFEQVASGDLTKDFNAITDFLGDFASMKHSFTVILKEFNSTLKQIKEVSKQVDSGSDEVAGASNDLASGTGEQASAVEELTATVETVSNMAEEAAESAEKAYDMMMESVKEALEEREQMQELQAEMQRIKEISKQIEAIAISIEEIASQTSLLALNASIEAARAGESGRGFAVVADQIGKLATDSAQAVINAKELISKTVEEVDKGNKVTEKTAVGFERIISEMENFAEIAKQTSEFSRNQAHALHQIEEGIDQISLVTQQNAASSEECSAISEELAARAAELDTLVNNFKLY